MDHETLVGYPGDKYPGNAGADDILALISYLENEGLRCCIIEVMALQYYGSERMQNVWALYSERAYDLPTDIS